ncbi:SepM family pheromone-processing serine protease [Paenibacillus filicis]|uniref:endopeptidase La n=1 Tax=Paenibacillus gyeongsangnamensis TaxID=3388067 RepID=A0ABT4Q6G9_9BACL|nr:SepM family pheromone-processing serine protease [Paenibacillus filicis]MCZ8512468.1 SepM family pheromone-processing serine protease [Paenibacillus filicis]
MAEQRHIKRGSRIVFSVFIGIMLIYLIYFLPLPYYIFMPGTAEVIRPMVEVKQPVGEEKGSLMLTTVRVSDATVFGYLASYIQPFEERHKKQELLRNNESESEYTQRQEVVMQSSQASAIQAAYNKLKIPYKISKDGVILQQVYKDFSANNVLQAGDYIVTADNKPVETKEDLLNALKGKKAGEKVSIGYKRKGVIKTQDIELKVLPDDGTGGPQRAGLGVVPADLRSIKAESENQQVSIKAGDIGGPSAGLMFSLEIYNNLAAGDITKGYKIAGTGTIDEKGNVGVIGGIQFKIVAADKAGAEIFFAPKDYNVNGQSVPNYSDAKKRAEEIHTKMKIVPVGTMDDALNYLASLSPKKG